MSVACALVTFVPARPASLATLAGGAYAATVGVAISVSVLAALIAAVGGALTAVMSGLRAHEHPELVLASALEIWTALSSSEPRRCAAWPHRRCDAVYGMGFVCDERTPLKVRGRTAGHSWEVPSWRNVSPRSGDWPA
jgi:hypothetical protein